MPLWLWITSLLTGILTLFPDVVHAAVATCTVNGVAYNMINPIALNPNSCPGVNASALTGDNIVFNVMETTFCLVRAAMGNAMFTMYCALVNAVAPVIRAALVLYIAIFSLAVLMQVVDGKDWALRLAKIALIYTFAVNPTFFYDYLYNVFVVAMPDALSSYMFAVDLNNTGFQGAGAAGTVEGKRMGVISNLDTMFNLIVGGSELIGYMLLAVAFMILIIGIPLFWLLLFGFLMALAAFFRVLIAYATALMALSFTLMFAPVFIPMLMFSRTSHLFFGWMRSVIGYSLEVSLILFFVFLIGGIKILYDPATQDAMMNDEDVNPSCVIVIGDIGIAEAIRIEVPCFTSVMSAIGMALYKLLFFCITYFITSALLFGFMGKVSEVAQKLAAFGGAGNITPAVTPGSESGTKLSTMEGTMMGGVASIRSGFEKAAQARAKIGGGPGAGAEKGAEKVQGGMKKMQEGGQKIQEGGKEIAEGGKDVAEGTAKAGAGTAKAGAGAGGVVGGVVAAPFTAGASLNLSAKGAGMMAEGGAQAAEGTAQAAGGVAKAAGGAAKVTQGTVQVAQGTKDVAEGAAQVATSKKDDGDSKKGDTRTGVPGLDSDDGKGGGKDGSKGDGKDDDGPGGGGSGGGDGSGGGSGSGSGGGGGSGGGDDSGGGTPPAGGGGSGSGGGGSSSGGSGGDGSGGGGAGAVASAAATTTKAAATAAKKASAATVRKTMRALPKGKGKSFAGERESQKQGRPVKVFEMDWDKNADKEREIKEAMEEMGFKQLKDYESYDSGNKIEVVFKNEEDEKKFEAILNGQDPGSGEDKDQKVIDVDVGGGEDKADEKPNNDAGKKADSDEGDTNKEKDKEEDK